MASSCASEPTTTPFLIASCNRSSSPLVVSPDDAKTQVDRGGRFDDSGWLEQDVLALEVFEHAGPAVKQRSTLLKPA
jgi:hypothetical protein